MAGDEFGVGTLKEAGVEIGRKVRDRAGVVLRQPGVVVGAAMAYPVSPEVTAVRASIQRQILRILYWNCHSSTKSLKSTGLGLISASIALESIPGRRFKAKARIRKIGENSRPSIEVCPTITGVLK